MSAKRILVVDDQPDLAKVLINKISSIDLLTEITFLDNLNTSNLAVLHNDYDFIFLDFFREGQIETVEVLNYLHDFDLLNHTVVYSSHFNQTIYNTLYEYDIHSYIPRGINAHIVEKILLDVKEELYVEDLEKQSIQESIIIKHGKYYLNLRVEDIHYVEVDGKYLSLYTKDQKYVYRQSLKSLLDSFGPGFLRIHAKYAINSDYFIKLDYANKKVYLEEHTLPLGRHYQKDFYQYFGINSTV